MFFLGVITLLYINPHWRLWCFNLVVDCMYSCYFCVGITLHIFISILMNNGPQLVLTLNENQMLGSKELRTNVLEFHFVMLANHDQNVLVLF